MSDRNPSRRAVLAWPLAMAAGPGFAQEVESDRGIGGTGVVPTDTDDRGLGGTGVIGTIQRFGSIYVNDLHITYPRHVAVLIDDRKALVTDLMLGHVVSVMAEPRSGGLMTHRIDVTSEVVGPIEAVSRAAMVVLGQTVVVPSRNHRRQARLSGWTVGEVVAVHGLRRLDGTIVASLIERRAPGLMRVSGPARRDTDGVTMIGSLPVRDESHDLAGRRVSLTGHMVGGLFQVTRSRNGFEPLLSRQPAQFSLEGYVTPGEGELRLGSGVIVEGGVPSMPDAADARAIVTADLAPNGALRLSALHFEGDRGLGGRTRTGIGAPGAAPSSPDPGNPTGLAPHGPAAPGPKNGGLRGETGSGPNSLGLGARARSGGSNGRGMR